MALALLRSCLRSRVTSSVSRQLRVYDSKPCPPRKYDFGFEHFVVWEYTKPSGRGGIDSDGGWTCRPIERTIDDDIFDELYATEDFGDVDDEERKELVLDYMFHLDHVDIVPHDMEIRRRSTKFDRHGRTVEQYRPPWTSRNDTDDWKYFDEKMKQGPYKTQCTFDDLY